MPWIKAGSRRVEITKGDKTWYGLLSFESLSKMAGVEALVSQA